VVGGIVGGLPAEAPPEPKYVRVGGHIKAPKLIHEARPEYPMLAQQARVQGFVILEARVGTNGAVQSVKVLRSIPLLDEAAIAAVQQWRYQPLLLNGTPMPFVLTVTVVFRIAQ
jgi:protein TonB